VPRIEGPGQMLCTSSCTTYGLSSCCR
jgi:hypothetical protein